MNLAARQARCERAGWWLARGVAIVPLKPRSKELQPGYGPHRAYIAAPAMAQRWFLNTDANLGVVLGGAAGLAVCDWDTVRDYQGWREAQGAQLETLTEQTRRQHVAQRFGTGHRVELVSRFLQTRRGSDVVVGAQGHHQVVRLVRIEVRHDLPALGVDRRDRLQRNRTCGVVRSL